MNPTSLIALAKTGGPAAWAAVKALAQHILDNSGMPDDQKAKYAALFAAIEYEVEGAAKVANALTDLGISF